MGTVARKLQAVLDSKAAIKAAIEGKGVTDVGDVLSAYAGKIESIQTGGWTGHADEAGLKAIGWTDEDIEYYQMHGVNWPAEEDEYHKVPQDNIDLYGVLTADNISTYKDRIVYLPKIDTAGRTDLSTLLYNCSSLVAIPYLDTSQADDMNNMCYGCNSLVCFPPIDTGNVQDTRYAFYNCCSLKNISSLDLSNVSIMSNMFQACYSLSYFNLSVSPNWSGTSSMFRECKSLQYPMLNGLNTEFDFSASSLIQKSGLMYMINNAVSSSYIKLSRYCYNKYVNDPDIVDALASKPFVTLASA